MAEKIFCGKALDECLELASSELNISKENIQYEIIENKQRFFKRKVSIKVNVYEDELSFNKDESDKKESNEEDLKIQDLEHKKTKVQNGKIKVENGKIIVKDPKEDGRPAILRVPKGNMKVLVDNVEVDYQKEVYEESNIEVIFEESVAQRIMNISISPDNMKVFINISYVPKKTYKLKDSKEEIQLTLENEVDKIENPPLYNQDEIKQELLAKGIKFGIIEENIENCTKMENVEEILVAEGLYPIDGVNDEIQIKFNTREQISDLEEDSTGRIDYKSIGYVKEVKKGDILAVNIKGKSGKDGLDVKGKIKKHIVGKKLFLKAGEGCELLDENTIVASIEGKPYAKGNLFVVHQLHEVNSDVDIKTGNVKFNGDIMIRGNVKEGMIVEAGHNLFVEKNVEKGNICAKGDLEVLGNVINSTVCSGGEEITKISKVNALEKLHKGLVTLIETVENIRKLNLIEQKVRDGEMIKLLIENKFKYIPEICFKYVKLVEKESVEDEVTLSKLMSQKLIDFGPLNINTYRELSILAELVNKNIKKIRDTLSMPVNIRISYCQDSDLRSSGRITITGKGEYVSNIKASESVIFEDPRSVVRGGVIKASNEIRCKEVGSEGGVSTKLIVKDKGNIWVDKAYQNTCFIVGGKEYVLDIASKDIHAYLDSKGELIVDKFIL
ncbi:flagellar assembly protein A [Clostridium brassicae]|uniref:FapA family protein n=1 Tax=Clostridium brassicae TaxID=2999072 RepID=A0ABT4DB57_9CLOT|nr:flagellar assembly protein A [Clostridium brassicae]MCY6959532.1 FapA family protein [Clostridium brassicae]